MYSCRGPKYPTSQPANIHMDFPNSLMGGSSICAHHPRFTQFFAYVWYPNGFFTIPKSIPLTWVISHVPMFHITQPWSVLMIYFWWLLVLVMSNSPKSWDSYQSLFKRAKNSDHGQPWPASDGHVLPTYYRGIQVGTPLTPGSYEGDSPDDGDWQKMFVPRKASSPFCSCSIRVYHQLNDHFDMITLIKITKLKSHRHCNFSTVPCFFLGYHSAVIPVIPHKCCHNDQGVLLRQSQSQYHGQQGKSQEGKANAAPFQRWTRPCVTLCGCWIFGKRKTKNWRLTVESLLIHKIKWFPKSILKVNLTVIRKSTSHVFAVRSTSSNVPNKQNLPLKNARKNGRSNSWTLH